jgi:hypothetical protein
MNPPLGTGMKSAVRLIARLVKRTKKYLTEEVDINWYFRHFPSRKGTDRKRKKRY